MPWRGDCPLAFLPGLHLLGAAILPNVVGKGASFSSPKTGHWAFGLGKPKHYLFQNILMGYKDWPVKSNVGGHHGSKWQGEVRSRGLILQDLNVQLGTPKVKGT